MEGSVIKDYFGMAKDKNSKISIFTKDNCVRSFKLYNLTEWNLDHKYLTYETVSTKPYYKDQIQVDTDNNIILLDEIYAITVRDIEILDEESEDD